MTDDFIGEVKKEARENRKLKIISYILIFIILAAGAFGAGIGINKFLSNKNEKGQVEGVKNEQAIENMKKELGELQREKELEEEQQKEQQQKLEEEQAKKQSQELSQELNKEKNRLQALQEIDARIAYYESVVNEMIKAQQETLRGIGECREIGHSECQEEWQELYDRIEQDKQPHITEINNLKRERYIIQTSL